MKFVLKQWLFICIALTSCTIKEAPPEENEKLIENLFERNNEQFEHILNQKDKYEVQVIYTQINRDSNNVPSFKTFGYNVDPERYFYPASTVKMPVAFLALEKLNEIKDADKSTIMLTDSAFSGQTAVLKDTTSESGFPTVGHYLKKIFLVSDNDAFNRLYEFLGQETINEKLKQKGYERSRIIHRLSTFLSEEENRHTNPIRFIKDDEVVYKQPLIYNQSSLPIKGQTLKGKGYIKDGKLISEPMDFTYKNFIPLDEMHMMLRAVIFPQHTDKKHTFNLTQDDYNFVYKYMSQLPSETSFPEYDQEEYHDSYSKLLMFGNEKTAIPDHIRIFNKYGQAYGYMVDNAYIVDTENKIEFMLSAVIHTNDNEIFNDGNYEYDEVAFPFMKNLGQIIYQYELQRERNYPPNLSKFMAIYDKITKVSGTFHQNLYQNYQHYYIPELNYRRIKRSDIEPYIDELEENPLFEVSKLGESVEGREINMVKLGNGPTKILLWSQMHGDESTATRSLFEIFKFFASDDSLNRFKDKILEETTLYFIPMLNPDGAEAFKRRNALSIDINRDALRLTSPEAKILKSARDKYEPEFGFNLHDQSKHYNVYRTGKTASISFLAPAYNYEKDINEGRGNAMKVIVSMNDVIQQYMPGNVGRYDDAFEPRAFGDNIQKWGTNTILIESGGFPDDPEKKKLVKMNFIAILHALHEIAEEGYKEENVEDYFKIPHNDRKFFDLLIRNGMVERYGQEYLLDIGIFNYEVAGNDKNVYHRSTIDELGDMSTFYGYKEVDANGMTISTGKIYPKVLRNHTSITTDKAHEWLTQGYTAVRVRQLPSKEIQAKLPIHLIPANQKSLEDLDIGHRANFIIKDGDEVKFAVINGRVIEVQ